MSACLQLITAANSLIAQIHLEALNAVVKMVIVEMAITVKVKVLSLCVCSCTVQGFMMARITYLLLLVFSQYSAIRGIHHSMYDIN